MTHSRRSGPRFCPACAVLALLLLALAVHGWAQEAGLRAATGGVAGRLVVLPTRGSGLYSWALPVTLSALLKQAQVEGTDAEALAALLKEKRLADLGSGLPSEWGPDTLAAATEAGQVGKAPGYVLVASWNTSEPSQDKWNDDTPFWLVAKLQRGPQVVFDTTRLPREPERTYRLADYDVAVRDLADMVVQNLNPSALEGAKRGDLWRQRGTLEQVRRLAEAEQDLAAGRLEEARTKLTAAQANPAGAQSSLLALELLVEVNAALSRRDPPRAAEIGRQAEAAGRALETQGAQTKAWASLSVAEGLRLQGKWPEAADAYLSWLQLLIDQNLMTPEEFFPAVARPELDSRKPRLGERITSPALEAQWWATVSLALYRAISDPLVAQSVRAHAEERAAADPDESARAAALRVLAEQASLRSDLAQALQHYQEALAIRERLAPGSLDCADLYNELGNLAGDQADYDRALQWYQKAVAIRERLEPDTSECAALYNNFGTVYAGRGDSDRALEWFQKALTIRERLAPGSLGCASTYNNLGAAYKGKEDYDRALQWYQQALTIYEKQAPDSRECATIYNNLGNVYSDKGDANQALQWLQKAVAIRERLAPGSLDSAMTYNNVASAYANDGDYDHALQWHRKSVPICERLAPGSPLCAVSYANVGQVYGHQGDFSTAVEWLHKALTIYEKLSPRSLDRASTASALGFYLLNAGQSEEAFPYLTLALEIAPDNAPLKINLAWGYLVQNHLDQAAPLLEAACAHGPTALAGYVTSKDEQLAKQLLAHGDPTGYYLLGRAWASTEETDWATAAYERFLKYAKPDHPWLAEAQARLKKLRGGQ